MPMELAGALGNLTACGLKGALLSPREALPISEIRNNKEVGNGRQRK